MNGHGRPARFGLVLLGILAAAAALGDVIAPGHVFATSAPPLAPPSWEHPFGSDVLGRDLWRAVVHGARVSLVVALGSAAMSLAIGMVVGGTAGYAGGLLDETLMRVTELFQVMPRFFLVLTAVVLFGSGFPFLVLVIGLTSWPNVARLVRSQALSIRTLDHVAAARALGASPARIVTWHVWPLMRQTVVAQGAFQASGALLLEAGVSFLGLGDPAVMTWGALLHEAHHFLRSAWWMALFPGLALTSAVLAFHLVGDTVGKPDGAYG